MRNWSRLHRNLRAIYAHHPDFVARYLEGACLSLEAVLKGMKIPVPPIEKEG